MGTYSAWESTATLRLLGGARGAWAPTGRRGAGHIVSPRAQLVQVIRSFHSIHNVADRGVLQAMWEELAGQVVHRDQLIIFYTTPI